MESYIGSISAYFGIYLASDLVEVRGYEGDRNPLEVGIYYAAWGLMWIHSSYANYCLVGADYGSKLTPPAIGNPFMASKKLGKALYDPAKDKVNDQFYPSWCRSGRGRLSR